MISVSEALAIVQKNSRVLPSQKISLSESLQCILADPIFSPIDMPPFRQSAMDGYALSISDKNNYNVIGEIKAGDSSNFILKKGEAIRIFTGAAVPDTANAVIMQEKVTRSNDQIQIQKVVLENENIRPKGEQIIKGKLALEKGTLLTPAAIGYLSGLGITEVTVFTPPKVGIIITGNELVPPGEKLERGKIYESNFIQLKTALHQISIKKIQKYSVKDDFNSTSKTLKTAIQENDIVLISGGISVGDYDFVGKALKDLGTKQLFYKVKQKPGKPLYFGGNNNKPVFALPGNPASSLTCFYIYVVPVLQKMMGKQQQLPIRTKKKSITNFVKKGDRAQFLKARTHLDTVEILEGQSSAMLNTYALSNALVYIPEEVDIITQGDLVETISLSI